MQRVLAWLFGTIVFLCMAAAITLGVLIYLVDPNIFKADIEKLAAEQGMSLDISGPLSWKLYPDIQILGSNIILASPTTSAKPLMRLEKAMLVVALKPLLKKQLAIKGLRFDGVDISLRVDENGRGNWQDIGPSNNTSAPKKADD
ncbi:MAG: AsmA family protein, partial [Spongiibacteraceae bacterium]